MQSNLNLAIKIATEAHDGQVDRGGAPYILHPLRVMLAVDGDRERAGYACRYGWDDAACDYIWEKAQR